MKRDEQSQREPAVKQRRALDGVDTEKKNKRADLQLVRTRDLMKRTDQEAERENKNLSTAAEPQRDGRQTADAHEVAGMPTSWAATTNVTGTQLEPD